jgi:serine protease
VPGFHVETPFRCSEIATVSIPPRNRKRLVLALGAAAAALVLNPATGSAGSSLPTVVGSKHVMWAGGQGYPSAQQASADNMIYHGGLVETVPAVYIVYWGTEWQQGFSFNQGGFTYTNRTVQNYVNTFFATVGGSPWAGIQTQYCQNIDPGFSCAGQPYAQYVTNPTRQLKGVWVDPTPVPAEIVTTGLVENATDDPIEAEAIKAAKHFGYNVNATYFVMTPPGHGATAYGSVYCAYHAETHHTTGHGVRYSFMPYVPEQGAGCGQNSVNKTNNAFGNGYLDGYSIVAGHEYAEAVTDPDNQMGTQDGWNDITTNENGDKCAWKGLQNINLASHHFAIQPMWSNEANGGKGACAVSR